MAKFQKGNTAASGKGRPRRSGFSAILDQCLSDADVKNLVEVIHAQALGGDTAAASILVNRLIPTIKPVAEPVRFDLPKDAPPAQKAEAILHAVADGLLDPLTGKSLIEALAATMKIIEVAELIPRIEALEAQS